MRTDAQFVRGEDETEQRVMGYFTSRIFDVDSTQHLDLEELVSDLDSRVENFNSRGSGYVLNLIKRFTIVLTIYRPLVGSSFIPTPEWLEKKKCTVNVKADDQLCFL